MSRRFSFLLPLVASLGLFSALPSAADPSVGQQPTLGTDACVTGPADRTKTVPAGGAKVIVEAPNVTPVGPPGPAPACASFVVDFNVFNTSTPPAGYTKVFTVSGTYETAPITTKDQCKHAEAEVRIFHKKGTNAFEWVGGGKLAATWHAETDPPACVFTEPAGYKPVSGVVPTGAEAQTYRVILHGSLGTGKAILARKPK